MFSSLAIQVSSRLEIIKQDHFKSTQVIEIRVQHNVLTYNNF